MSDYTSRAEELLRDVDNMLPAIGDNFARRIRGFVTDYLPRRAECLADLLEIVEDDSDGDRDNASRWKERCNTMRSTAASSLERAIDDMKFTPEGIVAAGKWHMALLANEERFFAGLAAVRVPEVRDYLVSNGAALRKYIRDLDEKWRAILDSSKRLQSDEAEIYRNVRQHCDQAVKALAEAERSPREDAVRTLLPLAQAAANEKGAEVLAALLEKLGIEIEGLSEAINKGGEYLEKKLQEYLDNNKYMTARLENLRSLMNAERGGVLPLFKETRRQVYDYWQRSNPDVAQDRVTAARSSIGDWRTAGAVTPGQQDDARRFEEDVGSLLLAHYQKVRAAAEEFQDKWSGVFSGPLSTSTQDQLFDAGTWKMNAEKLVAAPVPEAMERLSREIDGYFEVSFEKPLDDLKSVLVGLLDPKKEPALRAVELVQQRIRDAIRTRLSAFRSAAEDSRRLLSSSNINPLFERANMRSEVE